MAAPEMLSGSKDERELLTEELLEQLLKRSSPEAYFVDAPTDERSLAEYLTDLTREKGLKRADVVRGSALNPTFAYQLYKGTRKAGRDNAIRLAFGAGCTLRETQRLLRHAGVSELYCKDRRDAVIIYCIDNITMDNYIFTIKDILVIIQYRQSETVSRIGCVTTFHIGNSYGDITDGDKLVTFHTYNF